MKVLEQSVRRRLNQRWSYSTRKCLGPPAAGRRKKGLSKKFGRSMLCLISGTSSSPCGMSSCHLNHIAIFVTQKLTLDIELFLGQLSTFRGPRCSYFYPVQHFYAFPGHSFFPKCLDSSSTHSVLILFLLWLCFDNICVLKSCLHYNFYLTCFFDSVVLVYNAF